MIRSIAIAVVAVSVGLAGCNGSSRFERDELLHAVEGLSPKQSAAIDSVLADLFGSPDTPRLPAVGGVDDWLDIAALQQCSGEVISHEPGVTRGLYGRHCARCHGVTGDGRGPFALYQDPYPRDFRRGVFKWKRTYRDAPPTREDLLRVIERGVSGSAMPSFRLLKEEERDSLVQYVAYLAIRGQLERELVMYTVDELDEGAAATTEEALERLAPIVLSWKQAASRVVEPAKPPVSAELISDGRQLYHGERAGCVKCHGDDGRGLTPPVSRADIDYDIWDTQRRTAKVAIQRSDRLVRAVRRAFPPRPAWGKRLTEPVRGGEEPIDLFRRLHQGVAGTPMPALGPVSPGEGSTLTDDEIWSLVAYVRSLSGKQQASSSPLALGGEG